jgi:hypothetical protein
MVEARLAIAVGANQVLSDIMAEISDLHSVVFQEPSASLSPIILAVLFVRRLANRGAFEEGLPSFGRIPRRPLFSPLRKLSALRQKFTELTRDLMLLRGGRGEAAGAEWDEAGDGHDLQKENGELRRRMEALVQPEVHEKLGEKFAEVVEAKEALADEVRRLRKYAKRERNKGKKMKRSQSTNKGGTNCGRKWECRMGFSKRETESFSPWNGTCRSSRVAILIQCKAWAFCASRIVICKARLTDRSLVVDQRFLSAVSGATLLSIHDSYKRSP